MKLLPRSPKTLATCAGTALLAVFVIGFSGGSLAIGQEDQGDSNPVEAVDSSEPAETGDASDPSVAEAAPSNVLTISADETAQIGFGKAVDNTFAKVVEYMAIVLFHRLFPSEQEYIETNHVEMYYRSRGSSDLFQPLRSGQRYDSLSLQQAEALMTRGRLQLGISDPETGGPRAYRDGLLGEADEPEASKEKVEYVTLVVDTGVKYVPVTESGKTTYRKLLPPRDIPSEKKDDWLTPERVELMHAQGYLVTDPKKVKAGKGQPYLLTRKVGGAPIVVLWLALGSILFTLYFRFVNVWGFRHAVNIVRGVYDNPNEPGEVTHFQALASALSATVGLGNIAGVTIAMTLGGPGAFFWMLLCGVFGMTSKFVECTLGQMYRTVKKDGTVLGGPMQYLHQGLAELGIAPVGLVLSILFAVMCILASFGGGNMFQANQSGAAVLAIVQEGSRQELTQINKQVSEAAERVTSPDATQEDIDTLARLQTQQAQINHDLDSTATYFLPAFGVFLATMVGLVIIGGIKRIGAAASKIVPSMCLIYLAACVVIISMHIPQLPGLIASIFTEAFNATALGGGFVGVLVIGVQRAAFSNEAGVGSAAIAHSAAKTEEPVREGAVALLGPFIDTIVVCSMTALVILITGAWDNKAWVVDQGLQGAALTAQAFGDKISFFPYVLTVAIVLFAFSTIISWSYYGERCWERLFGASSIIVYRGFYVVAVFIGAIVNLGAVLDFSDMMILSMAFPNVFGCLLLAPKVRRALLDYWERYKRDEFKKFK